MFYESCRFRKLQIYRGNFLINPLIGHDSGNFTFFLPTAGDDPWLWPFLLWLGSSLVKREKVAPMGDYRLKSQVAHTRDKGIAAPVGNTDLG